jgi:hypothetical protein
MRRLATNWMKDNPWVTGVLEPILLTNALSRHVRFGSKADIAARPRHVRYPPQSGHSSARFARPFSAMTGHFIWYFRLLNDRLLRLNPYSVVDT